MPSYFYDCRECCKVFTLRRKIDECERPAACPYCGKSTTKRVIMGPFFTRKNNVTPPAAATARNESAGAQAGGPWTARMVDCEAINCATGIKISGNARVLSDGLKLRGNRIGVEVGENGELNDSNTEIE